MISGVEIEKDSNCTLCKITDFSAGLSQKIREQLNSIVNGDFSIEAVPEQFDYKYALRLFLERYRDQTVNTQKGMIGELLAHVLAGTILPPLKSISILKNKEEGSIKKGFDIVYLDFLAKELWYSEVKSGHRSPENSAAEANKILLGRAHADVKEKLTSDRITLWDSAQGDVSYILAEKEAINTKKLLSQHSPVKQRSISEDKNVILISALYETPGNPIQLSDLKDYASGLSDKTFKGVIVFSIQKATYEKVSKFLEEEIAS